MNELTGILKNVKAGEFGLTEFFVSILFSLVAGFICMLLYRLYFGTSYERNESLTRSFVVIAPSVSAIFWAIQYSLPLSLGLLGALSFVRFRTPVKKPEDIAFILLVIALSLLSSVFRFHAAAILLGVVLGVVVVKAAISGKRLNYMVMGKNLTAFVSTASRKVEDFDRDVRTTLTKELDGFRTSNLVLNDVVQKDAGYSLRYSLYLRRHDEASIPRILDALAGVKDLERVEVFYGKAEA